MEIICKPDVVIMLFVIIPRFMFLVVIILKDISILTLLLFNKVFLLVKIDVKNDLKKQRANKSVLIVDK